MWNHVENSLWKKYLSGRNHAMKRRILNYVIEKEIVPQNYIMESKTGAKLEADIRNYVEKQIIINGQFEYKSLSRAEKIMEEGGNFLDVGSNIGLYTCHLGAMESVRCISVEPLPENLYKLKNNVALSKIEEYKIYSAVLWSSKGFKSLESAEKENTGKTSLIRNLDMEEKVSIEVPSITYKELLKKEGVEKLKLMKVDVEGAEIEVIKGMSINENKNVKPENILIEFFDEIRSGSKKFIYDRLTSAGYKPMDVNGVEISSPKEEVVEGMAWFKKVS